MKKTIFGILTIINLIEHDISINDVSFQNINMQRFEHSQDNIIILASFQ